MQRTGIEREAAGDENDDENDQRTDTNRGQCAGY
jgi:hypothetical protein